ncbi:two-component regulator propeller domain-containing protein [Natronogracilivirga saccharolytica]|uniref:PorZ N-terminal beta-propeller domain-containing protein n=1 Tax=Natronogracilivirga saccharolytica TaxID=2812953 RepID=A0A8J7SAJ1_9BACT|nr:two-component regulator propeller domain-containing protein [Natronogracilivirga saccharolytica]MBP3193463.1 hypothetical protein [Natronogracilivirga saccharolytica]
MKHTACLLAGLLAAILFSEISSAQPIGTWQAYTSRSTVLEVTQDQSGAIWAFSEGGLFSVENGEISGAITTIDGMYRINPTTMFYDRETELLWLGYSDGMFESYDPETGRFRQFSDIARATRFSPRGVNQFVMMGDEVLVATDFGMVLFEPEREVTIDTYSNLGDFPSGSRVNSVAVMDGRIFAATPEGVAVSGTNGDDLVVPDSWTSYGPESGLGSNVRDIVTFGGDVYVLMGGEIRRFEGETWQQAGYFGESDIEHLKTSPNEDYMVAWNDEEVFVRAEAGSEMTFAPDDGLPLHYAWVDEAAQQLIIGTTNQGMYVKELQTGAVHEQYLPEGPYMNSFSDLVVRDGVLGSGSNNLRGRRGTGSTQSGYYLFRDDQWENYNDLTDEVLAEYGFHSAFTSAATADHFFFGSWGRGIVQHDRNTNEVTVWNTENSILDGFTPGSSFLVVTGMTADRNDQLWAISHGNTINPLYRFVPETEEWTVFPRLEGLTGTDWYDRVTVDSNDQLWIPMINDRNDGRGMVVKRVDGEQIEDGVILRDQTGQGNLPHPRVNAVVQDRRGEIWIGTQRGLARFTFPQRVIDGSQSDRQASLIINADETADSPFLLRTSHVTSIAVNSANQKWIGTEGEGVWLIEEDGGRHRAVKHFTTDNSPLISNSVSSVAYDDETGQVFMATDRGLVSYTDVVRGSVADMDDLFIYPNPFSYRDEDDERVVIDGLSPETTLRILSVDGRLVRRLETRGGRVEWDVRDFNNERVATGVYIMVAVDSQNDQRGVGKLVVIR